MGAAKRSSLADRKVLVARAPAKARAWVKALEARGAVVAAREVFTLESMVGEARAQRSIDQIDAWDWILLTSQNAPPITHCTPPQKNIKFPLQE